MSVVDDLYMARVYPDQARACRGNSALPNDYSRCTGTEHPACASCRRTDPVSRDAMRVSWIMPRVTESGICENRIVREAQA